MKGENLTKTGLSLFAIGLVILVAWTVLYDEEKNITIEGKSKPQGNTSKALLTTGSVVLGFGYVACLIGFAIASDFLNFALIMPKTNLIET